MAATIVFLHTAAVHIATFDQLLRQAAPLLSATHLVREDLLAQARLLGAGDAGLVSRVQQAMADAAAGAEADTDAGDSAVTVVCTCSTIGGAAERTPTQGRFTAMRIDRAMADRAVGLGPRVLLVAALQSTIVPTTQLIDESAAALGKTVDIRPLWVRDAWSHFERGDRQAYVATVAEAVRAAAGAADVVVLAQASMEPAMQHLQDLGVEVLASPALGVRAIVERLAADR